MIAQEQRLLHRANSMWLHWFGHHIGHSEISKIRA